jgi:autotransporter strand-loop-strand O-heptosyltransferase
MIYDNLVKNKNTTRTIFNINFVNGPFLEVKSGDQSEFKADFINPKTNQVEYSVTLKDNHWGRASKRYFVDWNIKIYKDNELVYDYKYNAKGKRVYIALDSKSIGDTLAWFPLAEEFRKKHDCQVVVSTFHNDLFMEQYPQLEFINPGDVAKNLYAMYNIGWFYDNDNIDLYKNVSDFKQIPLQQTASDILGLDPIEVKPLLKLDNAIKKEKQISIAIHSTAQSKYWNNPKGWQEVVDYLNSKGYTVKLISREGDGYMGNNHPKGIKQLPAGPMSNVIKELQKSEAFIGIGSGLSWLSWATDTPTILISGFSEAFSEVQDNVYRISPPKTVCSGCYNRFRLDAGDWNWCPEHKGTDRQFECSKLIDSSFVIEALEKILK